MIKQNTPIEMYQIQGHTIHVKREDLCTEYPLPPLAKMRGVYQRLLKVKAQGITHVGVFDTKVSVAGYGVGTMAKMLGMKCTTYYAKLKEGESDNIKLAAEIGEVCGVKPGRTPICYVFAKRHAEANDIYMMPQGLACSETTDAVAEVASSIPQELLTGSLVVCAGTGTILSGLIKGLPIMPQVYSISACISPEKQRRNITKLVNDITGRGVYRLQQASLLSPIMDYYAEHEGTVPFDANRHYDAKAWKWLVDNIDKLKEPVLFWNIGGNYDRLYGKETHDNPKRLTK